MVGCSQILSKCAVFSEELLERVSNDSDGCRIVINLTIEQKKGERLNVNIERMLPPHNQIRPVNLANKICDSFSEDELKYELCSELEVDYERLSGSNKGSKVRELIKFHERQGTLEKLQSVCHSLRPLKFQD